MSKELDFVLMDLKEAIRNAVSKEPGVDGYKFSKSDMSFKKVSQGNKTLIAFDIINFYPESFEFHFGIIVWIKELTLLANEFLDFIQLKEPGKWNTVFFEGDFVEEIAGEEVKIRNNYYHKVSSVEELNDSLILTCQTLRDRALPQLDAVNTLDKFRRYYRNNKSEIVKNFAREELFISSLLAAATIGKLEFDDLARYLNTQLDIEKNKGNDYRRLYFLLDKLSTFVNQRK